MEAQDTGGISDSSKIVHLLRRFLAIQQSRAEAYVDYEKKFTMLKHQYMYRQLCWCHGKRPNPDRTPLVAQPEVTKCGPLQNHEPTLMVLLLIPMAMGELRPEELTDLICKMLQMEILNTGKIKRDDDKPREI
ncbi:hypothetical protein CIPAW_07G039700 [Carya illinoinensis]|uniref:Uncharacterized protein n=1 Tax=Carya illinoinensis TaxID=32201 RepID=A0A8T1PZL6_CARIL|nr:hypothetical protein CIPAW_07G039700 [Carya illinoinensis]